MEVSGAETVGTGNVTIRLPINHPLAKQFDAMVKCDPYNALSTTVYTEN